MLINVGFRSSTQPTLNSIYSGLRKIVGWVERISVTQQMLINVGFRSSTQPTLNSIYTFKIVLQAFENYLLSSDRSSVGLKHETQQLNIHTFFRDITVFVNDHAFIPWEKLGFAVTQTPDSYGGKPSCRTGSPTYQIKCNIVRQKY